MGRFGLEPPGDRILPKKRASLLDDWRSCANGQKSIDNYILKINS